MVLKDCCRCTLNTKNPGFPLYMVQQAVPKTAKGFCKSNSGI